MAKQALRTTLKHTLLAAALAAGLFAAAFNRSAGRAIAVDAGGPLPPSAAHVVASMRQGDLPTDSELPDGSRCVNFAVGGFATSFGLPVEIAFCMESKPGDRGPARRR